MRRLTCLRDSHFLRAKHTKRMKQRLGLLITTSVVVFHLCSVALAQAPERAISMAHPPRIAIVLDDLGSQYALGLRAISLPRNGPITYAILPHTRYGKRLAELAHRQNDEIILHMPMEPLGDYKPHNGMLLESMQQRVLIETFRKNLDEIPYISGINNHMGSRLTQTPTHMQWIMEEIKLNNAFFFLDSRTSGKSIAYETAKEYGIPSLKRDIFLDSEQSIEFIEQQFGKLLTTAMRKGHAIAIGHPYPETLFVLEKYLPMLNDLGFHLVSLSDLLASPSDLPYQYLVSSEHNVINSRPPTSNTKFIYNHSLEHQIHPSKQR